MLLFAILNWKPVRFHHRFCQNQRILCFWLSFLKSASKLIKKKGKVNVSLMFYFNIMLTSNIHLTFLNVCLFKKSILGYCQEFGDAVMIRIVFPKCFYQQPIRKIGKMYIQTANLQNRK